MGLIGKVLSAVVGIPSSTDRALLRTLCLACLADGEVTELELGHAREIALEMPGFSRKRRAELQTELEEVLDEIAGRDRDEVVRGIAATLDDDEREQAFALAAVILYVDLAKRARETAFLSELRAALGLSGARADAILAEIEDEVASIQRGEQPAPGV